MAFLQLLNVFICCLFMLQAMVVLTASETERLQTRNDLVELNEPEDDPNKYRGPPGLPGRDGRDGRDSVVAGPPGAPGKPGHKGQTGPAGQPGSSSGTVFTRWGRKDCPSSSPLLYEGVVAGSHYTHSGGGSNYLCLPLNPIYDKFKAGNQGSTYIYGAEYEVSLQPNIFPLNLHDYNAACAVCHAKSRGSHLMIPARNVCPAGWTLEYKGYLMAEHYNHKGRTQFICVDANPSLTAGTNHNHNGALLYFVEGHCGSLPCLPYVQGKELTCVVCTK